MLLIYTNIICSILLNQGDSISARKFIEFAKNKYEVYLTSFAMHSFAITCCKIKKYDLFNLLEKAISEGYIQILYTNHEDIPEIFLIMQEIKLDFDDALQLYISKKHKLTLITLDKDFKKNKIKSFTPEEFLKKLKK